MNYDQVKSGLLNWYPVYILSPLYTQSHHPFAFIFLSLSPLSSRPVMSTTSHHRGNHSWWRSCWSRHASGRTSIDSAVDSTNDKSTAEHNAQQLRQWEQETEPSKVVYTSFQILAAGILSAIIVGFAASFPATYLGSDIAANLLVRTLIAYMGFTVAGYLCIQYDASSEQILGFAIIPILLRKWSFIPHALFIGFVYEVMLIVGWIAGLALVGVWNGDSAQIGVPNAEYPQTGFYGLYGVMGWIALLAAARVALNPDRILTDEGKMHHVRSIQKAPGDIHETELKPFVLTETCSFLVLSMISGYPLVFEQLVAAYALGHNRYDAGYWIGGALAGMGVGLLLVLLPNATLLREYTQKVRNPYHRQSDFIKHTRRLHTGKQEGW